MKQFKLILTLLLVLGNLISTRSVDAIEDTSKVANYLIVHHYSREPENSKLYFIDPTKPNDYRQEVTIPVPKVSKPLDLSEAVVSQNGTSVAILFETIQDVGYILVYDTLSKNWFELPQVRVKKFGQFWRGDQSYLVWSPDGRYLAFNDQSENETVDTFVFDILDGELQNLTGSVAIELQFAWDPNSQLLAIVSSNTPTDRVIQLQIWDVAQQGKQQEYDIDWTGFSSDGGGALCYLDWDSNSVYLSYVLGCDYSIQLPLIATYLIDLKSQTTKQITGSSEVINPSEYHPVIQKSHWLDNRLIVMMTSSDKRIVMYDPVSEYLSTVVSFSFEELIMGHQNYIVALDIDKDADEISLNLIQQEMAGVDIRVVLAPPLDKLSERLQSSVNGLTVSPDGQFVTYRVLTTTNSCSACWTSIGFWDIAQNEYLGDYTIPDVSGITLSAGWVTLEQ